jgi:hypothetical protein
VALSAVAASGAAAPDAQIERISAQLYYESTGTLSRDVMAAPYFTLFNTVIGEGDAQEPANDVLISVSMAVPNADANLTGTLVLTVKDDKGKVLAKRTMPGLLAIGGHVHKGVFLHDVGCIGDLSIEARYGTQKKTGTVPMTCGE